MDANYRYIHTNLYSDYARDVLDSVFGQLSDGIWENSRAMEKYWMCATTKRADDGEILIAVRTDYYVRGYNNPYCDMTDAEVLSWLAAKLKAIVKIELEDCKLDIQWKRNSESDYSFGYISRDNKHPITISTAYLIYDALLDRDLSRHEFSKITTVVSAPLSPEATATNALRAKKVAEITASRDAYLKDLDFKMQVELENVKAKYSKLRTEIVDTANKKISKLK